MPKLSIIVPVYKVEKYLRKCIDSILAQTFRDFELILVDDGSPDNCGAICDEYAIKDDRIKVLHKENGGLSDARNKGLDEATGEYIGFVDSDDYIENDMYEFLISNLEKYDADLSVCGLYDCCGEKVSRQGIKQGKFEFSTEQAIEYFLGGKGIGLFAVNKVYKKKIFENIRYPVGKLYEDAFVILDVLFNCNKIIVSTEPKYYYIHREESITISSFNKKYYDVVDAHEKNLSKIKDKFPKLVEVGEFRLYWAYKQLIYILAFDINRNSHKQDIKNIKCIIRRNIFKILKNKFNSRDQNLSYLLICISPYLFMYILRSKKQKGGFM